MICTANQLTGFYMRATLAFNGLTLQVIFHGKDGQKLSKGQLAKNRTLSIDLNITSILLVV